MRWKYWIGSLKYLTDIKHGGDLRTQYRDEKFPEKSQNKIVVKHLPLIWFGSLSDGTLELPK